jgi:hypothetical protein
MSALLSFVNERLREPPLSSSIASRSPKQTMKTSRALIFVVAAIALTHARAESLHSASNPLRAPTADGPLARNFSMID